MALTETQVSQLYVSIFGRASEGEGNKFWQEHGKSMEDTANWMLATDDAKNYFGETLNDNQAFVEFVYKNTFGKTIDEDPEGIKYWVNEWLEKGKSKGEMMAAMVYAATQEKNKGKAQDQFNNKVEMSNYVAEHIEKFNGDYKAFQDFIAGVTDDPTSVVTAQSKVQDFIAETSAVKLTTEPDNVTGTSGDDIFDGSVIMNPINGDNVNTYSSEDKIDGSAGNDTLIIQYIQEKNSSITKIGGVITAVEDIKFTAFSPITFDMSSSSGVKNFTNDSSISSLNVNGIGAAFDNLTVKNVNGKSTTVNFDSTVYAASDDSLNLSLENTTGDAAITITGSTIETLNIDSKTAKSKVDLGGSALANTTKLVITGDKDLSIDDTDGSAAMAKITTVDASALTGKLDLDLRNGGANKLDIKGGTADDRVIITNFDKADKIDLGDGKDLLSIDLTADVNSAAELGNIEQMAFRTQNSGDVTVNLEGATALEEIYMENTQTGTANTLIAKKVASTIKSVNFVNHDNTGATSFDNIELRLDDDSATDDALELNFGSVISPSNPAPAPIQDDAVLTLASFKADGVESLTIKTQNLGKDDNNADNARSYNGVVYADGGLKVSALNDDALQTLTIESDTFVDMQGTTLSSTVKTIDASKAAGGVFLDLSAVADSTATTAKYSVTTGDGADILDKLNIDVSSSSKTGAGNDAVFVDSADTTVEDKINISIDTGAGNDLIDVSSIATVKGKGVLSIKTGDGIDKIKVNGDGYATQDASGAAVTDNKDASITIKDFTAGVNGDKIDLNSNKADSTEKTKFAFADDGAVNTGTGDGDKLWDSSSESITLKGGLNIIAEEDSKGADSLTADDIATFLNNGGSNNIKIESGKKAYIVVTDGSDSALAFVDDTLGTTAEEIEASEIKIVAILGGVDDTSALKFDNFSEDFVL